MKRRLPAILFTGAMARNYSTTYTYDVNSNITALTRKGLLDDGSYGTVDDLTMTYNGNQLTRVSDAAAEVLLENSLDFNDGSDQTDEITYDSRGYMTTDLNRGITEIRYNHAGLPAEVYIDEVKRYTFTYNTDGQMLSRTEHITPSSLPETTPGVILPPGTGLLPGLLPWPGSGGRDTTTTSTPPVTMPAIYRYAGSQLWRGNTLNRIETEAGIIIGDTLHAAYRDFQGNVRTVVANGRVRQLTHYYPYGLPWAETTSPSHSLRKYSSKELYTQSGYDTYNFEARQYHPAVPRFTTPDPLTEVNPGASPYTYCSANPIARIDPGGLTDMVCTENNEHQYINDGTNQVIELTADSWAQMVGIEFDPKHESYNEILLGGKVRDDLFPTIEPVIPPEQCSVWGNGADCNELARRTNNASVTGSDRRIDTFNEYANIYDIENAIPYIKSQLINGVAVVAGVNHSNKKDKKNVNKSTNHFLNIVGMGFEIGDNGTSNYLLYYDNSSSLRKRNTDIVNNRLIQNTYGDSNILIFMDPIGNISSLPYILSEIWFNIRRKR